MNTKPTPSFWHLIRLFLYLLLIPIGLIGIQTPLATKSICYWYTHYSILCPMCGGTRSFLHFITLQFKAAYTYNPVLTLSVYPIATLLVLQDAYIILANTLFHKDKISLLLFFLNLFNKKEV